MTTRIDELINAMTLEEKCSLTAGLGMWSTKPIPRVGLPPVRLSDGPNGARGPLHAGEGSSTSACFPSSTAMAATWNPDLTEEVGGAIAQEALDKGSRVLLAPTVNIHRSPLAGRNFECYSEDPLLTGRMAVAFIRGAEGAGVACTVKHFVGNEAETKRGTMSSEIDERALHEIYLPPFEMAIREGEVLGLMTAYNRVNGEWLTEGPLLRDLVRGEWGFDGLVVTDWGGVGSAARSVAAGVDLEMPGPGVFYGDELMTAVERGEVDEEGVDGCLRRMLAVFERIGALDEQPGELAAIDRPEHRALARRAAADATVLLRNEGVLPLDPKSITSVAVIGPNAAEPTLTGGGASNFKPHYISTPLDAIRARFPHAAVRFEPGDGRDSVPSVLRLPLRVRLAVSEGAAPLAEVTYPDAQVFFPGGVPGTDGGSFSVTAEGAFDIAEGGSYTFSMIQSTPAIVSIDGEVVIDGVRNPPGRTRFPWRSMPAFADVTLTAGPHELRVTSSAESVDPVQTPVVGFIIGCRPTVPPDALERAVAAASECDVAIVVVGTDSDWETEAVDRKHMDLPGGQNELITQVCAANPRTVVAVNTGAPVTMPWADEAGAVIQSWYAGQEIGNALVDVLVGDAEPGGRLPTTLPLALEHNPSYGNFPGENGVVRYGEGVFVGYRWYASRRLPVRYPFGHGLSYTTFEFGEPVVTGSYDDLTVTVPVTNTGDRSGSEVVQLYVSPPQGRTARPLIELRAFGKVSLDPGATSEVVLHLDDRAFARWNPSLPDHDALRGRLNRQYPHLPAPTGDASGGWTVDAGTYELLVGRSSADITHRVPVEVATG